MLAKSWRIFLNWRRSWAASGERGVMCVPCGSCALPGGAASMEWAVQRRPSVSAQQDAREGSL